MRSPAGCDHRHVAFLSATVTSRSAGSYFLTESGVCRDCGAAVSRDTVMRPANAWATVAAGATLEPERVGEAVYLCVAAPERPERRSA